MYSRRRSGVKQRPGSRQKTRPKYTIQYINLDNATKEIHVSGSTRIKSLPSNFLDNYDDDDSTNWLIYINDSLIKNTDKTVKDICKKTKNKIKFLKKKPKNIKIFTVNNLEGKDKSIDPTKNENLMKFLNIPLTNDNLLVFNSDCQLECINDENYREKFQDGKDYYIISYPSRIKDNLDKLQSPITPETRPIISEIKTFLGIHLVDLLQILCILFIIDNDKNIKQAIFRSLSQSSFIPIKYSVNQFQKELDSPISANEFYLTFLISLKALRKDKSKASFSDIFSQLFDKNDKSKSPFIIFDLDKVLISKNIKQGSIVYHRERNLYVNYIGQSARDPSKFVYFDHFKNKRQFLRYPQYEKPLNFEDMFFELKGIKDIENIDEGAFGKVSVFTDINDHQYAVKIIQPGSEFGAREQVLFMRESMIMHKLNHPLINRLIGVNLQSFNDPRKLQPTIITEYMPNGNLYDFLHSKNRKGILTNTKKIILIIGIANAMEYLHEEGIAHRDLKTKNILLDENYNIRICDFGQARIFPEHFINTIKINISGDIGTPWYIPPEILRGDDDVSYEPKFVDVYQFAIVVYEIITEKMPYPNTINIFRIVQKVIRGYRPQKTDDFTDQMWSLLESCWNENPKKRPSFEMIKKKLRNFESFIKGDINKREIEEFQDSIKNQSESFSHFIMNRHYVHESEVDFIFNDHGNLRFCNVKLGESENSNVYLYENTQNDKFAVRIFDKPNFRKYHQMLLIRQSLILYKLNHPAILKFFGLNFVSFNSSHLILPKMITEYVPNGSLRKLIDEKSTKLDTTKKAIILILVASAMKYIHRKGIIYGQLNPKSILLDSNLNPKLKFNEFFSEYEINNTIPIEYIAPELIENRKSSSISCSIDSYSYGTLIYELFGGKLDDKKFKTKRLYDGYRMELPNCLTPQMSELVLRCWDQIPNQRIGFDEIYEKLSNNILLYFSNDVDVEEVQNVIYK